MRTLIYLTSQSSNRTCCTANHSPLEKTKLAICKPGSAFKHSHRTKDFIPYFGDSGSKLHGPACGSTTNWTVAVDKKGLDPPPRLPNPFGSRVSSLSSNKKLLGGDISPTWVSSTWPGLACQPSRYNGQDVPSIMSGLRRSIYLGTRQHPLLFGCMLRSSLQPAMGHESGGSCYYYPL